MVTRTRRRHDLAKRFLSGHLPGEEGDDHRHRPRCWFNCRERQRKKIFIPGADKSQQASCYQGRRRQRQQNHIERLKRRRAIHLGRLHQLIGQALKKGSEHPGRERQCE